MYSIKISTLSAVLVGLNAFSAPILANDTAVTESTACMTFDSALMQAAELSARLGATQAQADVAKAELRRVQANRWPKVSAYGRTATSGGSGLLDGRTDNQVGLEAQQRLFDFGKARYQTQAAQARLNAADYLVDQSRDETYYEVALQFIDILEARDRLDAATARYTNYQAMLTSLPRQLETNLLTLAEAKSIAAEAAIAESNMVEENLALDAAQAQMFVFTGSDMPICHQLPSRLTEIIADASPNTPFDSVDPRVEAHAATQAYEAERRAAQADLEQVRRQRLPTINASGVVAYVYDDVLNRWEQEERVGLNLSTPLWGAGRQHAEQDAARARRSIAEQNLDRTRRELYADFTVTSRRIVSGKTLLRARTQASVNLAQERDAITKEFENGQRTYHDVETAEAEYQAAILQQISAQYGLHVQQLRLLHLLQELSPDPASKRGGPR